MSKGIVFGGVAYLPDHPLADLHGHVRLIIRERCWQEVTIRAWEKLGITLNGAWNLKIWQQTKSHAETLATEGRYGQFLACSITAQYLGPENYRPVKEKHQVPPTLPSSGMPPADWRKT